MLDLMMTLVVPLTLGLVAVYAACRRVDVYDALIQGAGEGLGTLARIIPSLVGLMTAVYMLRAAGCSIEGDLETVKTTLEKAAEKFLS